MSIHDYLIDQSGKDWSELLSGWSAVLPPPFTVWLVNRFGDVFAVFEDGSVHMLDVGTGVIQRVADSRDDFATQMDVGDNASNWLMIPAENTQWRTSRRQICPCITGCWPIFSGRPKTCPTVRELKRW